MHRKQTKWLALSLLVATFSACLGGSLLVKQASAVSQIDESAFVMYQGASVRTEGTQEHPDATGLRFKTFASDFKEDLQAVYPVGTYDYSWYTQLRFTMWDGVSMNGDLKKYTSYESNVPTSVWNEDGWNTVLLNIPDNALAIDITAQSFVEVKNANGDTVYALNTKAVTYSAAQTASWALAYNLWKNDQQYSFLLNYVDQAITSGEIQTINLPMSVFAVEVGKSDDIQANSYPLGYGIAYTSDNTSVATVDSNGRVTGVAQGTANITLSIGSSIQKVCNVTVRASGDVATSYNRWTDTGNPWIYKQLSFIEKVNNISSQMYPFYHAASENTYDKINSESGVGQVVGGKIKITSTPWPAYYSLDSAYVDHVFGLSQVRALRIKLTGLSSYELAQFKLNYNTGLKDDGSYASYFGHEDISYKKDGDAIWLQFNRAAYERYFNNRLNSTTPFKFRVMFHTVGGGISGASALVKPDFYVEEISPVYDSVTEDFEYGMPGDITTDASSSLVKVTDRTMGRGEYSLEATPTANTLSVTIEKTYVDKAFANNTALQFRVYTDKDFTSVTVNGSASNVQYKYNADGQYYTIRISDAYKGANLTLAMIADAAFGTVYLDAFTGTNVALGANVTKSASYAKDDNGEPTFQTTKEFNFFAYASLGDGKLDGVDYNIGEATLETMLELKEAGFKAIMPQSYAPVGSDGAIVNYDYIQVLDLAHQAGLKVILTDSTFTALSGGHHYDKTNWQAYYDGERETSGKWQGAAVKGSAAYEMIKSQLSYYINHPAFMGVLVKDEPSAWMFDESLSSGATDRKSGAYGFTYKTIKRVALEAYGKDIYIHANLLPSANYSWYKEHAVGQAFPELTVAEYGAIVTGFDISGYAVDAGGYATDSAFYTDLENYISWIGANTDVDNNTQKKYDMQYNIMRARYGKYCELFLQVTGAPNLMLDTYPVNGNANMSERYLLDLQTAAEVAAKYNVALHIVAQTMTEISNTNPESQRWLTEDDVSWINSTLLSYGVKNIVYFTYHVHDSDGSHYFDRNTSFVDENGEKTKIWYAMQEIMSQNKAFASTYQMFDIKSTKAYYDPLATYAGLYGRNAIDVNYDSNLYDRESVSFTALTGVEQQGELTLISEFTTINGSYMYAVMNAVDSKYANEVGAYSQATLTFGAEYTHAIVWRNGVKTLVALDENNALEIENAAGEAVFIIPYKYIDKSGFYFDETTGDNGMFFPNMSEFYFDETLEDNCTFFPKN